MKFISKWNVFARMAFLETHVKSLNLDGRDMAILEARLDNLMARATGIEHRVKMLTRQCQPDLYATPAPPPAAVIWPEKKEVGKKKRVKATGRPKVKDQPDAKVLKRREYAREYYLRTKRKKVSDAEVAQAKARTGVQ
jgi:hypothetical protein